ncbi:ISL3 family transposase [Pseudoxanthomonas mexicana]
MDLLDLRFVQALSSELRDGVRIVKAEVLVQPVECPLCKAADPYRHDSREQEFADAPIRGQPVRIQFQRRRYRCRDCGKTFFEPLQGFSAKRNMTRRLVHYIARDSLIRTFADVARDVAVDVQTVRGVFQDFSEWLRENHPIATPRIMGIDEAKRAKVLCTVLTDLERREYFDMLPSRKAKPLNDYLRKMPDKDRVEVVAMDLHQGFVTAIARHMPKAIRVADRYHIARLAQNAFDKAHVAARKELPTGERLAMFRKRGLLALRDRRLTESERAQVAAVLSRFPLLLATYESKEAFLTIYEAKDRQQADHALTRWLERLPVEISVYFRELTSAVSNNREIILNYFDRRYTNAFTEAANGISKLLQRTGRGCGFEVMRVKLLYGKRGQVVDLTNYDNDEGPPAGQYGYAMGMVASSGRKAGTTSGKPQRRGPAFSRVDRLIGEGYYDVGNDAIAKELTPLIDQFAASA